MQRVDLAARRATLDELARVHSERYLPRIHLARWPAAQATSTRIRTTERRRSMRRTPRAAPALVLTEALIDDRAQPGVSMSSASSARPSRPTRWRDGALPAEQRRGRGGACACAGRRACVAIVDFDVHHGNGTQEIFYADPSVLYVSLHQFPFYPGSGAAEETGRGEGRGYTVNVPLSAGAGGPRHTAQRSSASWHQCSKPIVRTCCSSAPASTRISEIRWPRCRWTEGGFRSPGSASTVAAVGPKVGIGLVLEGGYDLTRSRQLPDGHIGGAGLRRRIESGLPGLRCGRLTQELDLARAEAAATEL